MAQYQEALRLKPDYADAHWNRALTWLLAGDFKQGWPEYEWRWQTKQMRGFRPSFPQPLWDGSSLSGKTILLWAEQGLGDTFQFVRYAPLVKQQGGTVLLSCPAELGRILHTCAGIDHLVTDDSPLPPFDVQVPLMSLPGILKTTLATVPASVPYLFADAARGTLAATHKGWRGERKKENGRHSPSSFILHPYRVGIVWQGNPRFSQPECRVADQRRSTALAQFEPVARLPGVRLFSLQKGYGTEQLAERQTEWGMVDLGEEIGDFMDTATVMMNLDLIISVDTSPLHLAGALGLPVWAVLPFAGCWRWLLDRDDSPWYPTMRLFRQKHWGDWAEVFGRITEEVRKLLSPQGKQVM